MKKIPPAEDFKGKKYRINGLNRVQDCNMSSMKTVVQDVSVAKDFRAKAKWDSVNYHDDSVTVSEYTAGLYKLVGLTKVNKNTLKLRFKSRFKEDKKKKSKKKPVKYKALVQSLDLYQDNLRLLLKDMLMKVFVQEDLKKLLKENKIEFIMDEDWIYLKSGKTAYRV